MDKLQVINNRAYPKNEEEKKEAKLYGYKEFSFSWEHFTTGNKGEKTAWFTDERTFLEEMDRWNAQHPDTWKYEPLPSPTFPPPVTGTLSRGDRVFVTQLGKSGKVTVLPEEVKYRLFAPRGEGKSLGVLIDGADFTIYAPLVNCKKV